MVKVNKCCCFSLETGGYIIGILGIIGSLIVIIFGASLLQIDYDEFVDELFNNIEIDTYPNPQEYYEAKQAFLDIKWLFVAILVVYVVVGSINLIGCICLTVGVNKRNHKFVIPWLIVYGLYCISIIVSTIFQMIYVEAIFSIISGLISLAINAYIWVAMYSLYKKLQYDRLNPNADPRIMHVGQQNIHAYPYQQPQVSIGMQYPSNLQQQQQQPPPYGLQIKQ